MKVSLFLLLAALGAGPAMASTVNIRSCNDGDTCRTTAGERIRISCIDAPERGEPGSYAATLALRGMVQGKEVGIRRITTDRYGRTVAELTANGQNVGESLVDQGHAWIYQRYAYQCRWAR